LGRKERVVICGAGIAGICAAYYLAAKYAFENVLLVEQSSPLALTSDKSAEAYRNWWPGPGPAMVGLMNRSIAIMEQMARESANCFRLNRRGYLYLTADPQRVPEFISGAEESSSLGAGPLRVHTGRSDDPLYMPIASHGFADQPDGADLFLDADLIRCQFPFVAENVVAALHARRCGWLSAHSLGMHILERARECGVRLIRARVAGIEQAAGRVRSVSLADEHGAESVVADIFINAAGPHLKQIGCMLDIDLPVFCELHHWMIFKDPLGAVPRDAPLCIWMDPQRIDWSEEESAILAESPDTAGLLGELPAGCDLRPEGGPDSPNVLMLWAYGVHPLEPTWPLQFDPCAPDTILRGLSTMIPALKAYISRSTRPVVDGGYYTKTRENRPLIGPLPVGGAYVIGALSGFGIMAGPGAGELLADWIAEAELPSYAPAFVLERYDDPTYQAQLGVWELSGQL
jgi:glycine/D-amino acid oxidase-like deaminating enzyme